MAVRTWVGMRKVYTLATVLASIGAAHAAPRAVTERAPHPVRARKTGEIDGAWSAPRNRGTHSIPRLALLTLLATTHR